MEKAIQQIKAASTEQVDMILDALRINIEGAEAMLAFQATTARRNLDLVASHSKAMMANQDLAKNPALFAQLVQDGNEAFSDYLIGSKAMLGTLQSQAQAQAQDMLEAQTSKFSELMGDAMESMKQTPAAKKMIEMSFRSWNEATHKGMEQATQWQKQAEVASESSGRLLAALTSQAADKKGVTSKRRTSTASA